MFQQVYEHLRQEILQRKIPPGEKIVETRLAAELEVSRSPVREAIRLLTAEQLIVERDGSPCVFQPSLQDFRELSDLRLAIEPVACQKAASVVRASDLRSLRDNVEQTRESILAGQYDKLVSLNKAFHYGIWKASANNRFVHIMHNVSAVVQYYSFLVLDVNQQQTNIVAEHTEIVNALEHGDEFGAFQAMHDHISKDLEVIETHVREFDSLSRNFGARADA